MKLNVLRRTSSSRFIRWGTFVAGRTWCSRLRGAVTSLPWPTVVTWLPPGCSAAPSVLSSSGNTVVLGVLISLKRSLTLESTNSDRAFVLCPQVHDPPSALHQNRLYYYLESFFPAQAQKGKWLSVIVTSQHKRGGSEKVETWKRTWKHLYWSVQSDQSEPVDSAWSNSTASSRWSTCLQGKPHLTQIYFK